MKNNFEKIYERDMAKFTIDEKLKEQIAARLRITTKQSFLAKISGWWNRLFVPTLSFAVMAVLLLVANRKKLPLIQNQIHFGPRVDDWAYSVMPEEREAVSSGFPSFGLSNTMSAGLSGAGRAMMKSAMPSAAPMADMGFSVGGAKDIGNFRENIAKGFMPQATDLTYEGLFYDYFFDTGKSQPCTDLFCPSYARAVTENPTTGKTEYYLSVGLNSNIKESDFVRPKTNFVVVLDISGSMSSPFDRYYYDGHGNRIEAPANESGKTKMEVANESLKALVDQLKPDDRLSIVLFSDEAVVAKPLRLVGETDIASLKRHIDEIQATNGTNMESGLEAAHKVLADTKRDDGYANRIIFMTDAMPNQGDFGAQGLKSLVEKNANENIMMTFMGVGVDFQSELVEDISKVRGANYLSIHSTEEFKKRLGDEFEYLVTPMVYDLKLDVKSSGFEIEKIYGSPDADISSGNIMNVRTLFPSKTENGETKGGLVLLKLRKIGDDPSLTLSASYEDTKGEKHRVDGTANFGKITNGTFENNGLRKGVLLAEYGELMQRWIASANGDGIDTSRLSQWEQQSKPLRVSEMYRSQFAKFAAHLRSEAKKIGDATLEREGKILDTLASQPSAKPIPVDDWMR